MNTTGHAFIEKARVHLIKLCSFPEKGVEIRKSSILSSEVPEGSRFGFLFERP